MTRDSLFGERILWSGRPKVVRVPLVYKVIALAAAWVALVTLAFAFVASRSLGVHVGGMLLFAGWCTVLAVGASYLPVVWGERAQYFLTDKHVIWRRGRIRRTISRDAISYAVIHWDPRNPAVGDLELVRAVPTGALRRTLRLTLCGVEAPDRVLSLIRGVEPAGSMGSWERSLAQRLDAGERVLWSAIPMASVWTPRRVITALLGLFVFATFIRLALRAIPPVMKVFAAHALDTAESVVLTLGLFAALLGLLFLGAFAAYTSLVRPANLARRTRYFVTETRVLIARGLEELYLDRALIAYVIDSRRVGEPAGSLHDVFLVLDGPHARALAPSGAFGGDDQGELRPVFARIADADQVEQLLAPPENRKAA